MFRYRLLALIIIGALFFWIINFFKPDLKYYLEDKYLKRNMYVGVFAIVQTVLIVINFYFL